MWWRNTPVEIVIATNFYFCVPRLTAQFEKALIGIEEARRKAKEHNPSCAPQGHILTTLTTSTDDDRHLDDIALGPNGKTPFTTQK